MGILPVVVKRVAVVSSDTFTSEDLFIKTVDEVLKHKVTLACIYTDNVFKYITNMFNRREHGMLYKAEVDKDKYTALKTLIHYSDAIILFSDADKYDVKIETAREIARARKIYIKELAYMPEQL